MVCAPEAPSMEIQACQACCRRQEQKRLPGLGTEIAAPETSTISLFMWNDSRRHQKRASSTIAARKSESHCAGHAFQSSKLIASRSFQDELCELLSTSRVPPFEPTFQFLLPFLHAPGTRQWPAPPGVRYTHFITFFLRSSLHAAGLGTVS